MAGPPRIIEQAGDSVPPGSRSLPPGSRSLPPPGWLLRGEPPSDDLAGLPPATDQLTISCRGEGHGVEHLSWGQLELWTAMVRQESWLPIGAVTPLPPGTIVDDVAAELRFLLSRYQTARTRLRFDPDGVKQVVAEAGEARLEVVDAPPDADPATVAEQLRQRYFAGDLDPVADWPVRMGVVRQQGRLTHRVLVMCHLVTDAAGATQLVAELDEWRRNRADGGASVLPPTVTQPMAQARWQRGTAGRAIDEAARRHWERLLRTVTPHRFADPHRFAEPHRSAEPRVPRKPRHWLGQLHSPAMLLALQIITARLQAPAAPVLLSLYAIALARLTGINPVVVQAVTDNRFRPGLAGTVSPASQTGLCVLDVAGATVTDTITRVRRQVLTAYKYAYYDPLRMEALVERVGQERGQPLDLASYFNDRQRLSEVDSGPLPTVERVRAALPDSTFSWHRKQDRTFEHLFVHIDNAPDRMVLTIAGDTQFMPPEDIEACVRGMERVAVEAATDPAAPTRVG